MKQLSTALLISCFALSANASIECQDLFGKSELISFANQSLKIPNTPSGSGTLSISGYSSDENSQLGISKYGALFSIKTNTGVAQVKELFHLGASFYGESPHQVGITADGTGYSSYWIYNSKTQATYKISGTNHFTSMSVQNINGKPMVAGVDKSAGLEIIIPNGQTGQNFEGISYEMMTTKHFEIWQYFNGGLESVKWSQDGKSLILSSEYVEAIVSVQDLLSEETLKEKMIVFYKNDGNSFGGYFKAQRAVGNLFIASNTLGFSVSRFNLETRKFEVLSAHDHPGD